MPNLEAYSEFMPKATYEAMAKLEEKIEERANVELHLKKYKELVERGEKRLKQIDEDELPELMDACGQDECKLKNSGLKLKIIENVFASIPAQSTIEKCKDEDEKA